MDPRHAGTLLHIGAGTLALVSMFGPMLTKKGGRAHRRWGRVYVGAMTVVVVSALTLSASRLVADPTRQGAWFLGMVAVLAGGTTWAGWRVRHEKGRTAPHRDVLDNGAMAVLALVGAAGLVHGARSGNVLFVAFGGLCALLGVGALRDMARIPTSRWDWWYRHMGAMLGSCIATVTAVLVVNASRLPGVGQVPGWVVWLAPTAVGVPGLLLWMRHWRRQLEGG